MSEDTIRLATIGRILRRRWRLLAVATVVGALVGFGASVLLPPRYTASASVLLPGQWDERGLLTQVNIATSSVVVDRAATELDWKGIGGRELRERVSAKATEGNIVTLAGSAETPERAQRLADQLAKQFVGFAARIAGGGSADAPTGLEALRQQVVQTNRRITELAGAADPGRSVESVQARTSLERLRTSLEEAMTKLDQADPANAKAGLVVMGPAPRPAAQTPPTRTQFVAAGALLFLLLGVVGHLVAARMNRRLRSEQEISAALGSTPLGSVDVLGDAGAHPPRDTGRASRLRRLLGADSRWDAPHPQRYVDEAGRRLRHQRVYGRLRDLLPGAREVLVVVPDGDEAARRAAGDLVAGAADAPAAGSGDRECPALRVVGVAVDRPMVPDREGESGALVVLSPGSWTAEDLAGIAGACADGRHEVVGFVVADTVQDRPARSAKSADDDALAVGGRTTGGGQ
ncbi:Wzz/FepE/Etk N-terminal domain-containing protein [Streptomyces sp. NPDC004111]|uniref:Wzz/FepE/Etk N-terminal domain-containing protein n=1 Tax=Streptomyces sp. NPDC004111 TaxID=3364690 RepID=UPI00367693A2